MRIAVVAAAASLSIVGLAAAGDADAAIKRYTNIPAQNLGPALRSLAKERNFQIVYASQDVAELRSPGAVGEFTADQALERVLSDTGFTYRYLDERTVTILPIISGGKADLASQDTQGASDLTDVSEERAIDAGKGGEKRSFWDRFRLAQVDQGPVANSRSVAVQSGSEQPSSVALEEIIVTAQKRSERLQDVPVPVTAIDAQLLVDHNQLRLQDYYTRIPALSFVPGPRGEPYLAIRGVTTDPFTSPTVSITVDDIPYGSSTILGGGSTAPDLDPGDLARVEVLRGPQGTLYGASSIGGLLKFVTVDPSTDGVSGRLQGSMSGVHNGDEAGYSVRGSVNLPISDSWAVRASGFTRRDPGYIDNISTGADGVNWGEVSGGRLTALWHLSPSFSLKLSALLNDGKVHGSSAVSLQSGLGDLQVRDLRGTGWYDRKSEIYSANLTGELGGVDITSVSGYTVDAFDASRDFSAAFGALATSRFGVSGAAVIDDRRATKFTQEVRLSASLGRKFEWLLGAFYTDEDAEFLTNAFAIDPATGTSVGTLLALSNPTSYEEYAAFADLTYHLTDRFDIQFGGRQSEIASTLHPTANQPAAEADASAFTYLVTPRFRMSPDLMLYARLASGYRAGGSNTVAGFPPQYDPDETQNYEIGVKGGVPGRPISFEASLYYIDWKNIQITLLTPQSIGYRVNGGRAKSQGVELSLETRLLQGVTIAAWAAWNDAQLTEDLPPTSNVHAFDGDRLPNSSRFSGSFSLEQEFPVAGMTGFWGGSVSYNGDRKGLFTGDPQLRQSFPGYAKTDLRAGVKRDAWNAHVFVNNVADKRGVYTGNLIGTAPFVNYIQPRTVGLSLAWIF